MRVRPLNIAATRVLVAEDDPDLCVVLAELLEAEGYAVLMAQDGRTALERSREEPLFAAILDLNLPGLAGHEVARELRRRDPPVPVVLMTGEYAPIAPEGVLLLAKPFRSAHLLATLRAFG